MPIKELGLPARAYNGLKRARINTVGDLLELTPDDLLDIREFGATSLDYVVRALDRLGLELRGTNS
jgi:DNA-directed RNA polymerase subunit alpha